MMHDFLVSCQDTILQVPMTPSGGFGTLGGVIGRLVSANWFEVNVMHLRLGRIVSLVATCGAWLMPMMAETHRVTIVADFQGPYSPRSIANMKTELAGIMANSGLEIQWKSLQEARGQSFDDVVIVRFKGKCLLEPVAYLFYDERGPLASTNSVDGDIQPFSEVACDRVISTMRTAMHAGDFATPDLLLGRALGRVVAHELVHIYTNSSKHSREGIQEEALSGQQLIASKLKLSDDDNQRLLARLR
jgi:hypothetical protein